MSNISTWSTTASSNNSAPPDGFPEGQAPSTLNNAAREVMAAVRRQHEQAEWIDYGHTPTRTGATTFTIPTDVTAVYTVGRRIRMTDSSTLYGTIASSSYSAPDTTVTVTMDSGSLTVSLSAVAVGIGDPTNASLTTNNLAGYTAPGSASATTAGLVELATDAETATGTDTGRAVTPANVASAYIAQGTHTIFVPASAMTPTVSNGCASLAKAETTAGRPDMKVLNFDASADEHAQFEVAFPKSWNEGTVTAQFFWTSTAIDTDGVTWAIQGVACSDGDTIDVAYGTAVTVDDANQSTAEDLYVSPESGAITIAGTPAAADMCFFRVFRDVSDANDTAAEDARLIGVKLFYTVNARDDS